MPIVQGSALWSLQRVFNHPRSITEPQTKEERSMSSFHVSSLWKSSKTPNLFGRRLSSTPCTSPKRSASAPNGIPLKLLPNPSTIKSSARYERETHAVSISKSLSVPHTFTLKPKSLKASFDANHKSSYISTSDTIDVSPPSDLCKSSSSPNAYSLDSPLPKTSPVKLALNPQEISPSDLTDISVSKILSSKSHNSQCNAKKSTVVKVSIHNTSHASLSSPTTSSTSPLKSTLSHTTLCKHSPHNSSPAHFPLKSSPTHSTRRTSIRGKQLPVTPSPSWSELVEARRRLLAVEGRRRALSALEVRVQQVHRVFIQTELRVARQREGIGKLVEAAGRAEVKASVHGQRIRRALHHHKPRLLACALCVPWPTKPECRGGQHSRNSCCALLQGRIQVLRGCVGNDELGTRN